MSSSLLNLNNVLYIFEQNAFQYNEHAVLQRLVDDELLSRLEIISLDVKTVLNLGCGTGRNSKALAKHFPKARLNLLDRSGAMLKLAKKNKPWFRKVDYCQNEATNLPIKDSSLDVVISNLMLQCCHEPDAIFREVQRVTRANGLFTFSTLGPDSFKELRVAFTSAGINLDELAFGHLTDMHDVGDALGRAGLREPVLDVDVYTLTFSSFAELWQELTATGNIFQIVSAEEQMLLAKHYPLNESAENGNHAFEITFEVVYAQAWAGDGVSKARTPDEVHIPITNIGGRSK